MLHFQDAKPPAMDGNRVQKRCPNGPARNADGSKQHKLNLRSWPSAEKSGTNIYTLCKSLTGEQRSAEFNLIEYRLLD